MRILLATDAWDPQVNGVVMTLRNTIRGAEAAGHVVEVIGPDRFRNIPCPTYPEIRLALRPFPLFSRLVERFAELRRMADWLGLDSVALGPILP